MAICKNYLELFWLSEARGDGFGENQGEAPWGEGGEAEKEDHGDDVGGE